MSSASRLYRGRGLVTPSEDLVARGVAIRVLFGYGVFVGTGCILHQVGARGLFTLARTPVALSPHLWYNPLTSIPLLRRACRDKSSRSSESLAFGGRSR